MRIGNMQTNHNMNYVLTLPSSHTQTFVWLSDLNEDSVCVCVCERERERERECVRVRESVCVCVCLCVRERESV